MTDAVKIALIAATPPTAVAIGAVILGFMNKTGIKEVHHQMNSRFDQWIEMVKSSSFAEGVKSEQDRSREVK